MQAASSTLENSQVDPKSTAVQKEGSNDQVSDFLHSLSFMLTECFFQSEFDEGYPTDGVKEETPCTERWTNLSEDSKKKMWGTFDETGVFIATCRHGVVLLMCDMIKSGEL